MIWGYPHFRKPPREENAKERTEDDRSAFSLNKVNSWRWMFGCWNYNCQTAKREDNGSHTDGSMRAQRMVTRSVFNLHENSWELSSIEDWMNGHGTTEFACFPYRVAHGILRSEQQWWDSAWIRKCQDGDFKQFRWGSTRLAPNSITREVQAFGTILIETIDILRYTI